jgi:formate hydrogenlyase subunit 4
LLGAFYRDIGDSVRKQARKQVKARRVRFQAMAAQMTLDRTLNKMPVAGHIAAQTFGEGPYSEYAHRKLSLWRLKFGSKGFLCSSYMALEYLCPQGYIEKFTGIFLLSAISILVDYVEFLKWNPWYI